MLYEVITLITEEALKVIARQTKDEIKSLESSYSGNHDAIIELQKRIKELRSAITDMDTKEHELSLAYQANQKELESLNAKTKRYEASLSKLLQEQASLKATLKRLNIVKDEEIKAQEAAKKRAEAEALAQREASYNFV